MKKQDNESLIQELTKRLDWYMMEASDEEFDAEEVQTLMKLLDSLKTDQEDNIDDELPVEEALEDFWKYYAKREEEEEILAADREEEKGTEQAEKKEIEEPEEKTQKVRRFFHRHRAVVVATVIAVAIILGGSWQAVTNAEKHGGFFWWMDKNEEGMTMITSPEEIEKPVENNDLEIYYTIEDVPEEYREYVKIPLTLPVMREYKLDMINLDQRDAATAIYVFLQDYCNKLHFEIKIYPQEILRIRDGYPEYNFTEEFEENGIKYEVFKKEEMNGKQSYIVYFYYENVKYAVAGSDDEKLVKEIAVDCGETVTERNSK